MKNGKFAVIVLCLFMALPLESCVVARPARPGPDFVWVTPRTVSGGVIIPGHWDYRGRPYRNKAWVPGHYTPRGKWVPGHWKTLRAPRSGAVWVPGHWGRNGHWVEGHWRYR